jgi:hypothetical protein
MSKVQALPNRQALHRTQPLDSTVAAAKLHVLHLDPIKARLGDKWSRLSALVHALFEKALYGVQGPLDGFLPIGELAYFATFHGRSAEESALICATIASEVCELLFGSGAGDISVRSLVGTIPSAQAEFPMDPEAIGSALEWIGSENLISKRATNNYATRLFPAWDLEKATSSFVFVSPTAGRDPKAHASYRCLDPHADDRAIAELELLLLQKAGAYTLQVQRAAKVCAVAAGVSWETLGASATRKKYVAALKNMPAALNCPLLVKIEDVPAGIQLGKLAEIVSALNGCGARVLIEFAADIRIPDLNTKLGAAGIGTVLPHRCSVEKAKEIISMLDRRLRGQNVFSFV